MEEFSRIQRLPPYVFNITGEMKVNARRRGEDIIDFGMGNPDGATPKHIVDKMIEAAQKPVTHRYSLSKGIPRLRKAICNWYKTRYDVDLDPRQRGDCHDRIEGGNRASVPGDSGFARHGAGAEPELSDSYLRAGDRRSARGRACRCTTATSFWRSWRN